MGQAVHLFDKKLAINRFEEAGARFIFGELFVPIPMGGQHNYRNRSGGWLSSENVEKLHPIHSGHLYIHDNQVKTIDPGVKQAHRVQTVVGVFNLMAGNLDDFMDQKLNVRTIFDDQNVGDCALPL